MEPKLRFKEFSGDWEEKKIGDIVKLKGGYAFDSKKFINQKTEFQVIKMGNVYQNELLLERNPSYIQEVVDNQLEYMLKKNDIIITLTGTIGKKDYGYSYRIKDNSKKLLLNQRLALIKNNKNCNPIFLEYIIKNKRFLNQFFASSTGGTGNQSNVSIKSIEKFKVNITSLPEQTKIADFLSTVDEKIQNQQDKITHLENIKKGFIQKIFSRKIRFKDDDGNEFPEWEEKKLGSIGEFKTSSVDKLINKDEKVIKLVNYMDVYRHKNINIKNIDELMEVSAKENQIKENNLIKGDILFTPSSETPDDIGHSIVIFEDLPNTLYSYHLVRFRPYKNILDILFSHYFCNTSMVLNQFTKYSQGATRYTLSLDSFKKVKVKFPIVKEEQQKIADFLSSFDKKIDVEKDTLDHLKELKKGILQQMFV